MTSTNRLIYFAGGGSRGTVTGCTPESLPPFLFRQETGLSSKIVTEVSSA